MALAFREATDALAAIIACCDRARALASSVLGDGGAGGIGGVGNRVVVVISVGCMAAPAGVMGRNEVRLTGATELVLSKRNRDRC